jgi:hypothetical protein
VPPGNKVKRVNFTSFFCNFSSSFKHAIIFF